MKITCHVTHDIAYMNLHSRYSVRWLAAPTGRIYICWCPSGPLAGNKVGDAR
jgi:hypothetical protein